MRTFIAILLLCAWGVFSPAVAQLATIRGFVTEAASGEAMPDVNVALVDTTGSIFGGVTNSDGLYVVPALVPGRYVLRVSFVGYATVQDTLQLAAREIRSLDIALEVSEEVLGEIIVEGDEVGQAANLTAGLQTIQPYDIERVPGPDVTGDLGLYLTALPGVVIVGDQGGQFYVRGGEPTQNLVLLDGMLIYQPFHILSYYSAFSSDVIRSVDLYAGGFGARFGGRISSVIDAWSRDGNNQRFAAKTTVSPFIVGGVIEGPIDRTGRFTFLTSFRRSVLEYAASRVIGMSLPLAFGDLFFKIHGRPHRHSRVSLTVLQTHDRGIVGQVEDADQRDEVRWSNRAIGGRYLFLPGSLPILAEFTISYSDHTNERGSRATPLRISTTGRVNIETNVTHYTSFSDLKWGLFARTLALRNELGGLYQDLRLSKEFVTEAGLYVAPEFKFRGGSVTPSLRIHNFPSKRQVYLEPRVRAVWQRGVHRWSGAVGLFHQEIVGIADRRDAATTFTAWTAVPTGNVPRAIHLIVGYQRELYEGIELSVESYYKRLSNLFIAEWTPLPRLTTQLQQANGRALGMDLRLEVQKYPFYGLINYGLSSVEYTAMQPSLELWFGSDTYRFRPAHDRRHQLNVLVSTRVRGVDVSMRWQFGSGLPFNRALGFDGFVLLDGTANLYEDPGERRVIYERPFNGILPTYHRLDISAERTFDMFAGRFTVQASVLNVYDRRNIFFLDVFTLQRADQLPLIPSLGVKMAID